LTYSYRYWTAHNIQCRLRHKTEFFESAPDIVKGFHARSAMAILFIGCPLPPVKSRMICARPRNWVGVKSPRVILTSAVEIPDDVADG
jgi:hypothetical protein